MVHTKFASPCIRLAQACMQKSVQARQVYSDPCSAATLSPTHPRCRGKTARQDMLGTKCDRSNQNTALAAPAQSSAFARPSAAMHAALYLHQFIHATKEKGEASASPIHSKTGALQPWEQEHEASCGTTHGSLVARRLADGHGAPLMSHVDILLHDVAPAERALLDLAAALGTRLRADPGPADLQNRCVARPSRDVRQHAALSGVSGPPSEPWIYVAQLHHCLLPGTVHGTQGAERPNPSGLRNDTARMPAFHLLMC